MSRALSVAMCLCLALLTAGVASADDTTTAQRALREGKYEEVARSLADLPKDARAVTLRVQALLALGEQAEASKTLNKLLKTRLTAAQKAEALTWRARVEADRGQVSRALETWAEALKLDPSQPRAKLWRGELMLQFGQVSKGRALLDSFADAYNDGAANSAAELTRVGIAVWRLEYYEDANEVLREATEKDPKHLEAWVTWGALFLEKYNTDDARFAFSQALKHNPRYTPALLGMARVQLETDYDLKKARAWIDEALAINPALPEAITLRAQLQIDDADYQGAERTLAQALRLNPQHLEALTLMAACAYLRDDRRAYDKLRRQVLRLSPSYATFYTRLAHLVARVHRYEDAIGLANKALKLDAGHWPAFVELGIGYTRIGDDKKGLEYLVKAHENDPFHVRAFNMVQLYEETLPNYRFVTHGPLKFRFHREVLPAMDRVVPPLAQEAFSSLSARYKNKPAGVHIEIFEDQETFSVRSVGLPNISPHGICFGKVVTARSPSEGNFNWAEVVWHELAHVFHLHLSRSRVPRWFTEGLAEFEAGLARPQWRREQDLEMVAALQEGRLLSVADLNHGFTHARSLVDIINAYFQSTLVIEFIDAQWGFDALLEMLKLYGKGQSTAKALKKATGLDVPPFDEAFADFLRKRYKVLLGGFNPGISGASDPSLYEKLAKDKPRDAAAQGRYALALFFGRRLDEAEAQARRALSLDPEQAHALYLQSFLALRSGDLPKARKQLEQMIRSGHDGYAVRIQLAQVAVRQSDSQEALTHYREASTFYPRGVDPYRGVAEILGKQGGRELERAEAMRQVTELDQNDFGAAWSLVALERQLGDVAFARRAAERAVQIRPFALGIHQALGTLALEDNEPSVAAEAFETELIIQAKASAQVRAGLFLDVARARLREGKRSLARDAVKSAAVLAPSHPDLPALREEAGLR